MFSKGALKDDFCRPNVFGRVLQRMNSAGLMSLAEGLQRMSPEVLDVFSAGALRDEFCGHHVFSEGPFKGESSMPDVFSRGSLEG